MKVKMILAATGALLVLPIMSANANIASQNYVDVEAAKRITKIAGATGGLIATTTNTGEVAEGTIDPANIITTGNVGDTINNLITNNTTIQDTITNVVQADLDGKADLQGPNAAVYVATVDTTGQYVRSSLTFADLQVAAGDVSGKADKVTGATNGNLAGLDATGNLTDSGVAKATIDTAITNITNLQGDVTDITNIIGGVTDLTADLNAKQDKANISTTATVVADAASETKYPSVAAMGSAITTAVSNVSTTINTNITNIEGDITDIKNILGDVTDLEADLAGKQDNLGGATVAGQLVRATATPGVVEYAPVSSIAIPQPPVACSAMGAQCTLTFGDAGYVWEPIAR
ncbi:MAG: hypothetical protein FWE52_01910 [Alphaproteobacteria bacterium]|nr:hypothetical protein [Alphaproteobacteria bacterium]